MPKVTIYTQVYNAKRYIEQCVGSVLSQTFPDFEYLLVDSASTDGSSEILDAFAAQDPRIRLFHLKENQPTAELEYMPRYAAGEYYTALDHDDWLEPDYLEKLLAFVEENRLDIGCTGTKIHMEGTSRYRLRALSDPLILSRENFPDAYPLYHQFLRTRWNKLVRMACAKRACAEGSPSHAYGGDTVLCFRMLRYAERIGVDSTVLHHYRIHPSSQSSQYDSDRFAADLYCYQDAMDFLSAFGPVSPQNLGFMQAVYLNAVADTAGAIHMSTLSPEDKLREYRVIVEHPLTQTAKRNCKDESVSRRLGKFLSRALQAGAALKEPENQDLRAVMQCLAPDYSRAVSAANAKLFLENSKLLQALLGNNPGAAREELLRLLSEKQYVKQYNIGEALRGMIPNGSPLQVVTDPKFFGKYPAVCRMILKGEHLAALDEMAESFLNGKKLYAEETLIQVFLLLAALENHADAFVFGKIRLARLYGSCGRWNDCRNAIRDLEEMGAGDYDEVMELRRTIDGQEGTQ